MHEIPKQMRWLVPVVVNIEGCLNPSTYEWDEQRETSGSLGLYYFNNVSMLRFSHFVIVAWLKHMTSLCSISSEDELSQ